MSGQLLLLNPAKRRTSSGASKRRKPRSAAQRAATARMLAANRKKHPRKAKRRSRTAPALLANPIRKRRAASKVASRRYKRNPIGLPKMSGIISTLTNAAIGGAGALAVDLTMGKFARKLPVSMATKYDADGSINWQYAGVKVAFAMLIGAMLPKALPGKFKQYARQAAEGSLTVQAYDIMRHSIPSAMTLGFVQPAQTYNRDNVVNMGAYLNGNMGAYLNNTGAGSADSLYESDERVGEGFVR